MAPHCSTARRAVLVVVVALALSACGTRVAHHDVATDAGATVRLDPATIAALRAPRAQVAPASAGSVPARVGSAVPPVVGGQPEAGVAGARPGVTGTRVSTTGTGSPAPTTSDPGTCPGPSPPVSVGQVGTFSGVAGAITAGARIALAVWARDLNTRGGLACHPVALYAADDAGDPARAAAAVRDLVARHHVIALVGDIILFSVGGFLPAITDARIPAIGGDAAATEWFTSPWMFPQGDSIDDQVRGIVEAGVMAGHRKLGFLYCVEVPACGYLDKKLFHDRGARAAGADPRYDSPVSLTQTDFTAQCLNPRNAGVDLLGLSLDGSAMARLARSCAAVGYRPLLAGGSLEFTLKQTEDPTLREFGMVAGSPVAPWMATDTPAARAFHAAMARYASDLAPDGPCMLAWTSGKLLEAAVDQLTAPQRSGALTTALILDGLGRVHHETLGGLTGPITFAAGQPHAASSGCNYFERLGRDGWTTSTGSKPVCHPTHDGG